VTRQVAAFPLAIDESSSFRDFMDYSKVRPIVSFVIVLTFKVVGDHVPPNLFLSF